MLALTWPYCFCLDNWTESCAQLLLNRAVELDRRLHLHNADNPEVDLFAALVDRCLSTGPQKFLRLLRSLVIMRRCFGTLN